MVTALFTQLKRVCLVVGICSMSSAYADIIVGPYTFNDLAFADNATQIGPGTIDTFGTAANLDEALTGYSPTKGIVNIGFGGNANLFSLDFTDLMAVNVAGTDIVLFDARFSADPYSIAVHVAGGSLSSFLTYAAAGQVGTGVGGPGGSALFGINIDISDYGLAPGTIVDAIQFSALPNVNGLNEGDPVMAAVLNGSSVTAPEPGMLSLVGLALSALVVIRRRRPGQVPSGRLSAL